jgi:hypothetical protein
MDSKILLKFFLLNLLFTNSYAQKTANVKFGKISPADFSTKIYSIDSNANAVVIADIGSSEFNDNSGGGFSLEFKHYRRVHILNKNGYNEANVVIPLYKNYQKGEQLDNVKAVTYNLENGEVVETNLEKKAIFEDVINKNWVLEKFTLPNIKEGSIIEFEYSIKSGFLLNLQPWEFQGSVPVLWSEYNLKLPEFLGYVFISQGYHQFDISEKKDDQARYFLSKTSTAPATVNVTNYHWVMKNMSALKEENFVSTLKNHISKIEFQLSDYRYPLMPMDVMGTWAKLSADLLTSENFGSDLEKNNGWLGDIVNPLIKEANDTLEKAKKIYVYVRDHFTCTSHNTLYLSQPLKNVLKTRNGTVADINLLLVAMFKYAGIRSSPVILSTRSHGYTYSLYPVIEKFNYVICNINIDRQNYFLDASEPHLGFEKLTPECYNGSARIIDEEATPVEFLSDSLIEKKMTSILLNTNDQGELIGSLQQVPGYYESYEIRKRIKEKGKDDFFKEIEKDYGRDAEITNAAVDSLDNLEEPVKIAYNFKSKQEKADLVYVSPMFGEGYKENPFKSAERFYPVEMPYAKDEMYFFTMFIPAGYEIDELPKSTILKLNDEDDGEFQYIVSQDGGTLSIRSRLKLKRAYYEPNEYVVLREFFNLIVQKQSEQIVLKRKK